MKIKEYEYESTPIKGKSLSIGNFFLANADKYEKEVILGSNYPNNLGVQLFYNPPTKNELSDKNPREPKTTWDATFYFWLGCFTFEVGCYSRYKEITVRVYWFEKCIEFASYTLPWGTIKRKNRLSFNPPMCG